MLGSIKGVLGKSCIPAQIGQIRLFARMTGRAGKMQHFRYGVAKVRGRWYYRYHKPIGRANWKGYQERYIKPKDVEAKQRLVFAPKATSKQLKQSISWQWRLPRLLASATSPNQVLDAWILFRYRHPKKICHYMMTLKRLVEVGGCEPTDWRLQVLLSRMRKGYKRVINIDLLVDYFSHLKSVKEIEFVSKFLKPRIPTLKPQQHQKILLAYARSNLRDTSISGLLVRQVERAPTMSVQDKVSIIKALGKCEIRNTVFVQRLTGEILKSKDLSLSQHVNLLLALADCGIRDFGAIELAIDKAESSNVSSTSDLLVHINLLSALARFDIRESEFAQHLLKKVNDPLNIPIRSLLRLIDSTVRMGVPVPETFVNAAIESIPLISQPSDIVKISRVLDTKVDPLRLVVERYMQLQPACQKFNVSELLDIFTRNGLVERDVWQHLLLDMEYSIENFEPIDLLRSMECVVELITPDVLDTKVPAANTIAEWSLKRWEEFTPILWDAFKRFSPMCSEWHRQKIDNVSL
jgi:hypothetical protein